MPILWRDSNRTPSDAETIAGWIVLVIAVWGILIGLITPF